MPEEALASSFFMEQRGEWIVETNRTNIDVVQELYGTSPKDNLKDETGSKPNVREPVQAGNDRMRITKNFGVLELLVFCTRSVLDGKCLGFRSFSF